MPRPPGSLLGELYCKAIKLYCQRTGTQQQELADSIDLSRVMFNRIVNRYRPAVAATVKRVESLAQSLMAEEEGLMQEAMRAVETDNGIALINKIEMQKRRRPRSTWNPDFRQRPGIPDGEGYSVPESVVSFGGIFGDEIGGVDETDVSEEGVVSQDEHIFSQPRAGRQKAAKPWGESTEVEKVLHLPFLLTKDELKRLLAIVTVVFPNAFPGRHQSKVNPRGAMSHDPNMDRLTSAERDELAYVLGVYPPDPFSSDPHRLARRLSLTPQAVRDAVNEKPVDLRSLSILRDQLPVLLKEFEAEIERKRQIITTGEGHSAKERLMHLIVLLTEQEVEQLLAITEILFPDEVQRIREESV